MQNKVSEGDYEILVTNNDMNFHGLKFTPAEAGKITRLIGLAGKMSNLPALPEDIREDHFNIFFSEEGGLRLVRGDHQGEGVDFTFDNTDDLINLINSAVQVHIDMNRLSPQPKATGQLNMDRGGDVYEGR